MSFQKVWSPMFIEPCSACMRCVRDIMVCVCAHAVARCVRMVCVWCAYGVRTVCVCMLFVRGVYVCVRGVCRVCGVCAVCAMCA